MRAIQNGGFYLLEYFFCRISCFVFDSSTWNSLFLLLVSSTWNTLILLLLSALPILWFSTVFSVVSLTSWLIRVLSYFCWWIDDVFLSLRDNFVLMVPSTGRLALLVVTFLFLWTESFLSLNFTVRNLLSYFSCTVPTFLLLILVGILFLYCSSSNTVDKS